MIIIVVQHIVHISRLAYLAEQYKQYYLLSGYCSFSSSLYVDFGPPKARVAEGRKATKHNINLSLNRQSHLVPSTCIKVTVEVAKERLKVCAIPPPLTAVIQATNQPASHPSIYPSVCLLRPPVHPSILTRYKTRASFNWWGDVWGSRSDRWIPIVIPMRETLCLRFRKLILIIFHAKQNSIDILQPPSILMTRRRRRRGKRRTIRPAKWDLIDSASSISVSFPWRFLCPLWE